MSFRAKRWNIFIGISAAILLSITGCNKDKGLTAAPPSEGAAVELSATVDRAVANPGDVITLTLRADYRTDVSLALPDLSQALSDFRVVSSDSPPPVRKDDRIKVEQWYKLQTDTAGSYVIEPVEVSYVAPNGTLEKTKTPKIFIEIQSLLGKKGEAEDIRDIKPPIPITSYGVFFMILAILAAAIVILALGRKLIERWRQRLNARKFAPRSPQEEALEALEELLKQRLIEKGRMREFCFAISEIFRRYIQARFFIPAIDLTTEEILPRIEDDGIIADGLKPLVMEFLTSTDLVKFAKHQPVREEMEKIITDTRRFIDMTAATQTGDI